MYSHFIVDRSELRCHCRRCNSGGALVKADCLGDFPLGESSRGSQKKEHQSQEQLAHEPKESSEERIKKLLDVIDAALAVGMSVSAEMPLYLTQPTPHRWIPAGMLLNQDPLIEAHRLTTGQAHNNVFQHQSRLSAEH